MRCLSPHPNYSIQVFEGEEQVVVDARGHASTIVLKKPVLAEFQQGGLLNHEIEAALESFNFSGIPEGVNPLTRVASFDSEAYVQRFPESQRESLRSAIDERLSALSQMFPSEFIVVNHPASPKPWPLYDEHTIKEIVRYQRQLGVSPESIRLYEIENKGRPDVVEAMLRIENPDLATETFGEAKDENEDDEVVVSA